MFKVIITLIVFLTLIFSILIKCFHKCTSYIFFQTNKSFRIYVFAFFISIINYILLFKINGVHIFLRSNRKFKNYFLTHRVFVAYFIRAAIWYVSRTLQRELLILIVTGDECF